MPGENERRPIGAGGAQYINGADRTVAGPQDEWDRGSAAHSVQGYDPNAVNSGAATAEPVHLLGDEGPDGRNGPRFYTAREIAAMTPEGVAWVIEPWIAADCTTLLLGKAKAAGKTTFVLRLVAALLDGNEFLGKPTQKTSVVYLSEQSPESLQPALEKAGLLDREDLLLLPYCWLGRDDETSRRLVAAHVPRSAALLLRR
jgi:AAA domain-containing protein